MLRYAAVHYFHSWRQAVTLCGIDYEHLMRYQLWDKKKIKEELKRFHRAGMDMSYNQFERAKPNLFHATVYHFGNWENALRSIGINYHHVRKLSRWNQERVLREIRSLKRKGADLSWKSMQRQGHSRLLSMACYYFKNWRTALTKTGLDYKKIRKRDQWNGQKIIQMIRVLHRKGVDISHRGVRDAGYIKLASITPKHFGNWGKAVKAAGFNYAKIKRK